MKQVQAGIALQDLGCVPYAAVWDLQRRLVDRRAGGEIADTVLLCEHPHVITLGRGVRGDAPGAPTAMNSPECSVPVVRVERGGLATYHGPGQLVIYPIVRLDRFERGLDGFLRTLEEVAIRTCREMGVSAERRRGCTGVWTGAPRPVESRPPIRKPSSTDPQANAPARKVASIGVAVRRWVTYHGLALNVTTDLKYFHLIRPCGFDPAVMTSLSAERGTSVDMRRVREALARHTRELFGHGATK